MRPPKFWSQSDSPWAKALGPLSDVYSWAHERKWSKAHPAEAGIPVVCVGNLTLGGAGKTPVVRWLRKLARERGVEAHVLMRGHGGRLKGPARVDPDRHEAADVGDEALLHAKDGPVWVARDRAAGAAAAREAGARMIIMDDGFQNAGLAKDVSLLVIDAETGFGNGRVFPAGPMRERPGFGLARADAVVLMGSGDPPDAVTQSGLPVHRAKIVGAGVAPERPVLAFAGIGRPGKFFDSLHEAGARIIGRWSFADHHVFTLAELRKMRSEASRAGADLITTEKDHARLPREWRAQTYAWPVDLEVEQEAALAALLRPSLDAARGSA